ncbi:HD-GYP domain-containing protein [Carboxydothermus ferrireducens]|uniref:Nucleotidyltransferase with HDIG domain n=2 Tax=Carboxydothermus TaxID=129957 RepID=A0ABX2RC39_9THEO|nr:HD domain-containing phosphohydrolase [Carboxydothermus ferrireducens]NYE57447.1 putative nucleotidyltransferase with HDIG domain [Carboxydothermus ferrireducens DSM 11255]
MVTFNRFNFIKNMSKALDLSMEGLQDHHRRVAYIAYRLGEKYNLTPTQKRDLVYLGLIHDIGILRWDANDERIRQIAENEFEHCRRGALILKNSYFDHYARYIFSHHDHYVGKNPSGLTGEEIPLLCRVLFLADRIAVNFNPESCILEKVKYWREYFTKRKIFDPRLLEVFFELAEAEEFWLTLGDSDILNQRLEEIGYAEELINLPDMIGLAELFAKLVDHKSRFTFFHSQLVGEIAEYLGKVLNFGQEDVSFLKIAGLLHDIGKMSVPESILEKPGDLTEEEFLCMKKHSFYTYYLLKGVFPEKIVKVAAYHHEKLDGSGYPFKKKGEELGFEERLLAVIDIFVALLEERPYRKGLDYLEIKGIMEEMGQRNKIDRELVRVVLDNYPELQAIKKKLSEA